MPPERPRADREAPCRPRLPDRIRASSEALVSRHPDRAAARAKRRESARSAGGRPVPRRDGDRLGREGHRARNGRRSSSTPSRRCARTSPRRCSPSPPASRGMNDDVYATMLRLYRESRPAEILPISDAVGRIERGRARGGGRIHACPARRPQRDHGRARRAAARRRRRVHRRRRAASSAARTASSSASAPMGYTVTKVW